MTTLENPTSPSINVNINPNSIFGSASLVKEENDDVRKMISYKKEDFREDIRKSKTNSTLHQKRIRVFQQNVIQKCEEQCQESLQIFFKAEKESNLEQLQFSISKMKELSQESRSQKYLLNTDVVKYLCVLVAPAFRQYNQLQIDVCWILANLSCEPSFDLTKYENLPKELTQNLLMFLDAEKIESINAAFWCLSNLAGDPNYTQIIYEANVIGKITSILEQKKFNEEIICQISYTYLNITDQIKNMDEKSVQLILSTINEFSDIKNDEIIFNLIRIINNISKEEKNAHILRTQFNSKLMNLIFLIFSTHNHYYLESILECVGNLIHLNESFARVILEKGFNQSLVICLETKEKSIRMRAGWVISNILSCSQQDIDDIFNHNALLNKILTLIVIDTLEVKSVLLQGLFNALEKASKEQISNLVKKEIVQVLYNVLKEENNEYVIIKCIDILHILLTFDRESQLDGEQQESVIINQLSNTGLIEIIQNLQNHSSDHVYNKIVKLINDFFDFEESSE
ncbi:hypothetical protein ABPG72_021486 [Tetrahymena utriculariae]